MVSTNFTKPSVSSTGFGVRSTSLDILLLQTDDEFLLQDDSTNILIESGRLTTADFTVSTIPSSNYFPDALKILLLETGYKMLLQDGSEFLFLEEIPGKQLNYTKPSVSSTNFSTP